MSEQSNPALLKDDQVASVAKEFVYEGLQLPTNLYVRMAQDRYVMIGKKGDAAKIQHLSNYKSPDFRLYVVKSDFQDFITHVTALTQKVMAVENLSVAAKATMVQGMLDSAMKDMEARGFADTESLKKAGDFVGQLRSKIDNFAEIDAILASLPENDTKHSMIVCLISMMILEEMQLNHKQAGEKLSLGALLHDLGLKFIPPEIVNKEPHLRSREEAEVFESHPIKGAEAIRNVRNISQDVLLIIAEHHELANGTGFPKKMRDVKISPLARIVSLANCYVDLIYCPGGKEYSPDEALNYINDVLGMPYNRAVFSALKNLVNRRYIKDKAKAA